MSWLDQTYEAELGPVEQSLLSLAYHLASKTAGEDYEPGDDGVFGRELSRDELASVRARFLALRAAAQLGAAMAEERLLDDLGDSAWCDGAFVYWRGRRSPQQRCVDHPAFGAWLAHGDMELGREIGQVLNFDYVRQRGLAAVAEARGDGEALGRLKRLFRKESSGDQLKVAPRGSRDLPKYFPQKAGEEVPLRRRAERKETP